MKYFLSIVLIAISLPVFAKDDQDIINLVNKWNEIHNSHNTREFLNLYAPEVLFYGKKNSSSQCYWLKEKFLNSDFRQEIISDIIVTHYTSGIIKADFTKRTTSGKKTKEHSCYLLFKDVNGQYRISGESDIVTDANKNVILDLGEVDNGSNNSLVYVILIITACGGIYWWIRYQKQKQQSIFDYPSYEYSKPVVKETTKSFKPLDNSTKEKGDLFEKFVIERFKKPFFTLIEWRSDKIHNGTYAESNMYPDMEYYFKTNHAECTFAVECKWRSSFSEEKIDWAKDYQLDNYRKFSAERRMRVFVIIGVGGQPENPRSLYIIPLDEINSIHLYQVDIYKYYRYGKGNFFFDTDSHLLR